MLFISGLTTKKLMNYEKITKQAKCLQRKTEVRSCNHRYRWKAMSITYSQRVSVALVIQHAPYCRLWPVRLYNIFPHYLIKGTVFEKKKFLDIKYMFWFPLQLFFSETFHILELSEIWSTTFIGVHVKYAPFIFFYVHGTVHLSNTSFLKYQRDAT